jgi:putative hemolysin
MQQGDRRALRLGRLIEDEQGTLAGTLAGTNVMHYLLTSAVAFTLTSLIGVDPANAEIYTVAILTPVIFVFAEVVPKNVFQRHADSLMPRFSWLLYVANRTFRAIGLVWLMKKLTALAARWTGAPEVEPLTGGPKRYIASLLQEALSERHQGEDQSELIERVVKLSDTPVRFVMVPQHRVVMISADADRERLVRLARSTEHARVLVYGGRRTQIIGLVKIDELLRDSGWRRVGERVVPVLQLRPFETVANAMARMQRIQKEMAIVTGFGGGLLGMVTLRDLLDEVVGEIT